MFSTGRRPISFGAGVMACIALSSTARAQVVPPDTPRESLMYEGSQIALETDAQGHDYMAVVGHDARAPLDIHDTFVLEAAQLQNETVMILRGRDSTCDRRYAVVSLWGGRNMRVNMLEGPCQPTLWFAPIYTGMVIFHAPIGKSLTYVYQNNTVRSYVVSPMFRRIRERPTILPVIRADQSASMTLDNNDARAKIDQRALDDRLLAEATAARKAAARSASSSPAAPVGPARPAPVHMKKIQVGSTHADETDTSKDVSLDLTK
ncbi:hypothetical protein [Novacetimonas pomaceti]|uniref:hypothetical protein n=1 Tax=Novacetimonas pomaceti TaxID=2021998 RepID=UPI001C2DC9A8|nr:hypothetical protein [Novacetimonas pomaceti]MBV1833915.1 hypothetical protein [Novacetimonas pomaceti]